MSKKKIQHPSQISRSRLFIIPLIFLLVLLIPLLALQVFFLNKVYPGIYIANTSLTALTQDQAKDKINKILEARSNTPLEFEGPSNQKFTITPFIDISPNDLDQAINQAFDYGRTKFYLNKINIPLRITFTADVETQIKTITQAINQPPLDSQLKINGEQISVTPSQNGQVVDEKVLKEQLRNYLLNEVASPSSLPLKTTFPNLSYEVALEIKKSLDQIKLTPLKLTFKNQAWEISLEEALSFLDLNNSQPFIASTKIGEQNINISKIKIGDNEISDSNFSFDLAKIRIFLQTISTEIDRPVEEPLLTVDPASPQDKPRITEFRAPQVGFKLQINEAANLITQKLLAQDNTELKLPVQEILPKSKLVNDLGIKELIGRGVSHFAGSIPNRIFNVEHTAKKLNGLLIAPGEIFSFVNTVGDISAATGFKQAYVIKSGRTVLDDGGGVCQVSTTIFRAALNSGLPIPKRTAHAYRVAYYEQGFPPGLDATIYHPSVDFQFKNDTPAHILIQAYTAGTTLYIDLYGTSDGRIANISNPIVTDVSPAPPELRQDDPTLPKGTVKQVDWAAKGATVTFSRTVVKNGETIIKETFKSVYRPWQAVFLVGTKEG